MSLPFGPPVPVSPLIRGLRFAFLIAGIIYARGKQRLYNMMEASDRRHREELKIKKDKEMAILKARVAAEENEVIKKIQTGEYFK